MTTTRDEVWRAPEGCGSSVTARARVSAERRHDGTTRLDECWGEPPLLPRQTSEGVQLVGAAAGPLDGDVLACEVSVGAGANLSVGSVAATYARPGASGAPSVTRVAAVVGAGGELRWAPRPVVAVHGCRHRSEVRIDLAAGATLLWAELWVLGRHGEAGGSVVSRRAIDVEGRPLSRQELRLGAADRTGGSPAVLGRARVVGSCVIVHPEWEGADSRPCPGEPGPGGEPGARVGVLPLGRCAVDLVGVGRSAGDILAGWERAASRFAPRAPVSAAWVLETVGMLG